MSDEPIVIKIEGDDTQGHASAVQWTSDDEAWIKELSDSEKPVRIRIPGDSDDTEGHAASATVSVVVTADDDDTEGHAMSLHFPSAQEANDFRRKLMATGLISATIAIGVVGGAALASSVGDVGTNTGAVSAQQATNLGQYDPANMGGTQVSQAQATNQGQYDPANMGGTQVSQTQATNQGQYDPANLGGTQVSQTQATNQGQYDPANMGGTPQASEADDEATPPVIRNRTTPQ